MKRWEVVYTESGRKEKENGIRHYTCLSQNFQIARQFFFFCKFKLGMCCVYVGGCPIPVFFLVTTTQNHFSLFIFRTLLEASFFLLNFFPRMLLLSFSLYIPSLTVWLSSFWPLFFSFSPPVIPFAVIGGDGGGGWQQEINSRQCYCAPVSLSLSLSH
jgi:hypothetical protein